MIKISICLSEDNYVIVNVFVSRSHLEMIKRLMERNLQVYDGAIMKC